jgi:hypothetical protein
MHWTKVSLPSHTISNLHIAEQIIYSLSSIEQKIVLSLFIRRFNPGTVLKKKVSLIEAVTAVPDDPLEVLVNLIFE